MSMYASQNPGVIFAESPNSTEYDLRNVTVYMNTIFVIDNKRLSKQNDLFFLRNLKFFTKNLGFVM